MKGKKVSNYELFFDIVCSDPKKLDFFEAGQKVSKIEESTIKFWDRIL